MNKKNNLVGQIELEELSTFKVINNTRNFPIKVALLYDDDDISIVTSFVVKFDESKILFINSYGDIKDISQNLLKINYYVVFFVSEKSMKNYKLIRFLLDNYKSENLIPLIIDPNLQTLHGRVDIFEYWVNKKNYAYELLKQGKINKDICQEYFICSDIADFIGDFFKKTIEENLAQKEIQDIFIKQLALDRNKVINMKKEIKTIQEEPEKNEKEEYILKQNIIANQVTVNTGGSKSHFETIQNEGIKKEDFDKIINDINLNLESLSDTDTERILDAIDIFKEEMNKDKPKKARINNCIDIFSSILKIATGIPALANNLNKLIDYAKMLPVH